MRALDADTGRNLWSFDSGGALSGASWDAGSSSSRGKSAAARRRTRGDGAPTDPARRRNVFPGVDGALYAHHVVDGSKHVVRRLPVTTRELVDAQPSARGRRAWSSDDDRRRFMRSIRARERSCGA